MIAQVGLTVLLLWIIAYAWAEHRRVPLITSTAVLAATAGLYFVWLPAHASWLAAFVGIGRGADLILYVWLVISLILFLDLHLKLRSQTEIITTLARELAIAQGFSGKSPPAE
jgi:small membrane protein